MNIELVRKIELPELIGMLKNVTLLNNKDVKIYENARIDFMKNVHTDDTNTSTFYLVKKDLEFQRSLREFLLEKHNIDTLHLDCALELFDKDAGEKRLLTPPVIELTPRCVKYHPNKNELSYDDVVEVQIPVIIDGAHRVYLARELGETFNAIYVAGAKKEYPFYAHPNEWHRVKVFDDVPKTYAEKKFYSREPKDCYVLYRDFSSLNIGKPRFVSK